MGIVISGIVGLLASIIRGFILISGIKLKNFTVSPFDEHIVQDQGSSYQNMYVLWSFQPKAVSEGRKASFQQTKGLFDEHSSG